MHLWISRLTFIASSLLIFGSPCLHPATARPRPGGVTCRACVVVDDTGATLWARRAKTPLANASTTKMLTALTVLELGTKAQREVVVSEQAAATGGGGLDLETGDVLTAEELLYAMLLSSSNDASVALAEHAAGSERAFVAAMNSHAIHLGALDSHFVTPHGLDTPGHRATASDLALVGAELLSHPLLKRIVGTEQRKVVGPDGPEKLKNSNPLLGTYRGVMGIKTGFTDGAGEVLVVAAQRHRRRLIAVAMGSRDAAADSRRLLDYGWSRLARSLLLREGEAVGEVTVGDGGSVVAVAGDSVRGWARPEEVSSHFVAREVLSGASVGEPVGRVDVYRAGRRIAIATALSAGSLPAAAPEPTPVGEALGTLLGHAFRIASLLGASPP